MKKQLVFVLVALALFAAACSGDATVVESTTADDNDSTAETDSTSSASSEESDNSDTADSETMAESDTAEGDTADSDTAESDTEESAPAPTVASAADEGAAMATAAIVQAVVDADDWCTAAAAVEEGTDILDEVDFTNPAELEQAYTGAQAMIAALPGWRREKSAPTCSRPPTALVRSPQHSKTPIGAS